MTCDDQSKGTANRWGHNERGEFIDHYEISILEQKLHGVQKGALRATTVQWWSTHQKTRWNWCEGRRQVRVHFGGP